MALLSEEEIYQLLESVKDPEIPSISVVELGIVREVQINEEELIVRITPTYSGCPALQVMQDEIEAVLCETEFKNIKVELVLSPPWTTDWISELGKQKLKEAGIAPPGKATNEEIVPFPKPKVVACPYCDSKETELRSEFSSTACKSLYFCQACNQPFDSFKSF